MRALYLRGGPRLVAAGSSLLLTTSGLMMAAVVSAAPANAAVGQVAPYVDMSNSQEGVLNTVIAQDGVRAFTAAFTIGEGCSNIWGDTLPIGNDPTIDGEINQAKSAGASLIISSGGAAGEPISFTCTNQGTIDAAYQAEINDYGTKQLDFDIEGGAVADTGGIQRTVQAMKDLQGSNPGLTWSFTWPVTTTGLDRFGTAMLSQVQSMGVTLPVLNIMTMDYNQGTGTEMGNAAISAAQGTLSQMRAVNGSYSFANIGITPDLGINDDGSTFTLADASSVVGFAGSNGIGRLAFWSVDRDQACPGGNGGASSPTCSGVSESTGQFSKTFTGGGSGGPPPPPPPGSGPITGYQGMCLDIRAAGTADGTPAQVYTCNGTNAQTWSQSGNTLQALGKCLDVSGAGTANGTKVQLWTCNGTGAQSWTHQSNGEYINTNSGKCLDDTGFGGVGTQVQIWSCADSSNQQWSLP